MQAENTRLIIHTGGEAGHNRGRGKTNGAPTGARLPRPGGRGRRLGL